MLLRLAYLRVTNAFAVLRLLRMSDRDKDVEILVGAGQAARRRLTARGIDLADKAAVEAVIGELNVARLARRLNEE